MRLGVIARADDTGLGHQTREFVRHMNPDRVLVIDLTQANAKFGKFTVMHPQWYPKAWAVVQFPLSAEVIDRFVRDLDVIFTVECPYNHYLYEAAHREGCKVVKQPNYEFLELLRNDRLPKPDLLIPPTDWHVPEMQRLGIPIEVIPCPIATDRFSPEVKRTAKRFLHLAGHKTYMDRNGTEIVKRAADHVTAKVEIVIKETIEPCEYWELYDGYDVLLLPRRYGGLSLQIQEASAAGLVPVIGEHDVYDTGVKVESTKGEDLLIREVINLETNDVHPKRLAETIDRLAGEDITDLSRSSIEWAEARSWDSLQTDYQQALERCVQNPS